MFSTLAVAPCQLKRGQKYSLTIAITRSKTFQCGVGSGITGTGTMPTAARRSASSCFCFSPGVLGFSPGGLEADGVGTFADELGAPGVADGAVGSDALEAGAAAGGVAGSAGDGLGATQLG